MEATEAEKAEAERATHDEEGNLITPIGQSAARKAKLRRSRKKSEKESEMTWDEFIVKMEERHNRKHSGPGDIHHAWFVDECEDGYGLKLKDQRVLIDCDYSYALCETGVFVFGGYDMECAQLLSTNIGRALRLIRYHTLFPEGPSRKYGAPYIYDINAPWRGFLHPKKRHDYFHGITPRKTPEQIQAKNDRRDAAILAGEDYDSDEDTD